MANYGYSVFCMMTASRLWKELSEEEKTKYNNQAIEMNYNKYFETLTPEEQNAQLLRFEGRNLKRMAAKKDEDGQLMGKKQKFGTAVDNCSLQMLCNSNMDKYSSKHPKLTKQELKSPNLASNQSLFKAEKMTEPLKPPLSAAAYYVMTHHSELGNLTPAEIDVLWEKVSKKKKKKCIKEHHKKHMDYVDEFAKFIKTLNPSELGSYRTIMENRARDQEDDVKESSDDESESISTNEDQTGVACSDHDGQNILRQE